MVAVLAVPPAASAQNKDEELDHQELSDGESKGNLRGKASNILHTDKAIKPTDEEPDEVGYATVSDRGRRSPVGCRSPVPTIRDKGEGSSLSSDQPPR